MKKGKSRPPNKPNLRQRAEERLVEEDAGIVPSAAAEQDNLRLVHELQVHQVELELQNEELTRARQWLETSRERYADLYDFAPVGYVTIDKQWVIREINHAGAALLGGSRANLQGRNIGGFLSRDTREAFHDFMVKICASKDKQTCEVRLERQGEALRFVHFEGVAVEPSQSKEKLFRMAAMDITERRLNEEIMRARLRLMHLATSQSLPDLMRATLDEVGLLTGSPMGFYHFVEPDQKTLTMQAWSTRTTQEFCRANSPGLHNGVDEAGVWVDCVRQRKPVIHNDYASLPHKKGLPPGHAQITRELVTPIIRGERIVAIMGVGNRPRPYTEEDAELVSYLADVAWEIIQHKRTEEELAEREERFRALFNSMTELSVMHELVRDEAGNPVDYRILDCNPAFTRITGIEREKAVGALASQLYGSGQAPHLDIYANTVQTGEPTRFEGYFEPMGKYLSYSVYATKPGNFAIIAADVTQAKKAEAEKATLEARLRQAQKMEAIGTLAGGIAHDFNNILAAIMGFSELALDATAAGGKCACDIGQIITAAERARNLVRQILAFSRKTELDLKPLDLNQAVGRSVWVLERTIPKMIAIETHLAPDLYLANADATQIEQVLLNLASNAADAMSDGGRLTIETHNVTLDDEFWRQHMEVLPGPYVMLTVCDSGHGMDTQTRQQIFDPFFTTKEVGKGTGLGLSSAYGMVKSHGGHIYCYSEPGQGTIFKIYLPALSVEGLLLPAGRTEARKPVGGGETILVVDDETPLRELGGRLLANRGYSVLKAHSGEQAIELYGARHGQVDLVILDLNMPGMGGHKCLRELLTIDPLAKVIIASGYSVGGQVKDSLESGAMAFVAKPYKGSDLLATVRDVLDGVSETERASG